MIVRADNSGLGTLSWEFARHLKPAKVLIRENGVFQTFPERYAEFEKATTIEGLLDGIDVLLSIETFYENQVIPLARRRGVKTALVTMFEMSPPKFNYTPDLLLCPSKLDYEVFKGYSTRVEYVPVPVATDRLHWKKRDKANLFVHTASHGGMNFRKGTPAFLEAIKLVKNPGARFRIYSWVPFESPDPRCEIQLVNFKNYWQAWRDGDVLVYPQDYNGICLPIIEAMSSGLGVITTDIYPFNEYMPKRLLFGHLGLYRTRAAQGLMEVDAAKIDPTLLAAKIDEIAGSDISEESEYGRTWSVDNSWERLGPEYEKILKSL